MTTKKTSTAMRVALTRAATNTTTGCRGWVSSPAGTALALQERGLTSWGRLTDAGYAEIGYPTLAATAPTLVRCVDAEGAYEEHVPGWDKDTFARKCKRCSAVLDDN